MRVTFRIARSAYRQCSARRFATIAQLSCVEVLEDLAPERAADILEEMSPDDAADLVADLDQDVRDDILRYMEPTEAAEVQELLGYPEDTAGGIMTTAYISVGAEETAGGAIELLREWEPDAETIYYVYVTDDDDHLVGVLSLRDLIVAPPTTLIADAGRVRRKPRQESGAHLGKSQAHKRRFHAQNECA